MSRSFGDFEYHPSLTATPEVHEFDRSDYNVLVMACDGVFDVLSNQEVINIALYDEDPTEAAIKIRNYAFQKGSTDNLSVIVIRL